jgi:hypothetical protein
MALSAFEDEDHRPGPAELKVTLGKTAVLWEDLISHIGARHPPITELWHFGGSKYGWSLRLKRRERIVLYLIPQRGDFLAGVVLGEKAVQTAQKQGLPADVLAMVDRAPRYAEGRGVRFTVTTQRDVKAAVDLAAAKMLF